MRKIVSYAFFRSDFSHYERPECGEARGRVFVNYLRLLVRAHWAIWRGWELRIHHDDRAKLFPYWRNMERWAEDGLLTLVDMGRAETLCGSMLWRLRPAFKPDAGLVVCRDVDSVPVPRDRRAVEEFEASDKSIHVIHEAQAHSGIMGGTLSVKAAAFRDLVGCRTWREFEALRLSVLTEAKWNEHGSDQSFLSKILWPKWSIHTLLHELHHWTDMAGQCETRTRIDRQIPREVDTETAAFGDGFSRVIGGCCDVEAPFAFYRALGERGNAEIRRINETEVPFA